MFLYFINGLVYFSIDIEFLEPAKKSVLGSFLISEP